MTCIVGVVDKDMIVMGGDSAGVSDHYSLNTRADRKVFVKEGYLFGFTTSFRMGQLLRYAMVIPARKPNEDLDQFMCGPFIDSVRSCLTAGGWSERKDTTREVGGTFLVGHAGRLFCVEGDYQVAESTCGFNAIGCGFALALGAMAATREAIYSPQERVELALKAAEEFSAGVRGPFHTETLP
jgi:ATP-dependent protease HslVU (ClpYQ) peptidase subunit